MRKKMHSQSPRQAGDSFRREYDFSGGARGKHAARYAAETNVVVLDPDVAAAFPNSVSVNEALRGGAKIISHSSAESSHSQMQDGLDVGSAKLHKISDFLICIGDRIVV